MKHPHQIAVNFDDETYTKLLEMSNLSKKKITKIIREIVENTLQPECREN